ncbi:molecular chaperone [Pectobacterium quasiaquaticum]|uniref:Molecular chaperone n=1 Tax=Pectobacterium quasiaquaticum TaxID=2774015 RepID=A0A9Q2ID71_9GAMM|nr:MULTISPECIES: molecular chaperone [Pectobacterium]MBE5202259.1 molecular chaperone [Pectobacterium quasiaquaticum]MBE5209090.1 molecular chaperone [Pectobacterium quasiaquaticum]MBE5221688.1 molecular chaperone [Pectobacterium quasiaquaticum]MBN3065495.1 molecular chaperone [Pectobacterium aquaticum]URG50545.1 molecular chaperone [Pectobacterium quasiaquaticum]
MNEFSIVCRLLGTLFYRQPQDPLLMPLFTLIKEGKLAQHWPLEQDALLARLQKGLDLSAMAADYQALFDSENGSVSPLRSSYESDADDAEIRTFLQQRGMPLNDSGAVGHFGSLLLAASWLEDQAQEDETAAQITLFDEYLLPWSDRFLGKVESHATTAFYRTLAIVCREALEAMRDELGESDEEDESEAEE